MGLLDRFFGPPTEDKFAQLMQRAMRRAGDDRTTTIDSAEFRLVHTCDGKEVGVTNLRNLFTEFSQQPRGERRAWLARVAVGLLHQPGMPDEFEDARPDILPSVRPLSMLNSLLFEGDKESFRPATLPLTENLMICLCYDLPRSMQFITQDQLAKWGVSLYEAYEVARQNLREREMTYVSVGERMFSFVVGDAYDATRLLLLDPIRAMKTSGDPVALPVARDTLLITGADDDEGLTMMAGFVEQQKDIARPLCPIPLRLVGDEWQVWRVPVSRPSSEAFRVLELRYWLGEYSGQKEALDAKHEQDGTELFVASYSGVERENKVLSYSVWSKGVRTSLPRADFVCFFDPENEPARFVRWQRAVDAVGDRMETMDCYPPRWTVSDFPSAAEIEAMQPEIWQQPGKE